MFVILPDGNLMNRLCYGTSLAFPAENGSVCFGLAVQFCWVRALELSACSLIMLKSLF